MIRFWHWLNMSGRKPFRVTGTSLNAGGTESFTVYFVTDINDNNTSNPETITVNVDASGNWEFTYIDKYISSLKNFAKDNTTLLSIDFSEADDGKLIDSGSMAFKGCSNLHTFVPPTNKFISMGANTFWYCSSLSAFYMPDSVRGVSSYSFAQCTSLATIHFSENMTGIFEGAFSGCTNLTPTNQLPTTLTRIDKSAFSNCRSIASLTIPSSVSTIGTKAFENVQHVYYSGSATGAPWGALAYN